MSGAKGRLTDLGKGLRSLRVFFHGLSRSHTTSLADSPWLTQYVVWGEHGTAGPRDVSEFTAELLQCCASETVTMALKRRVRTGSIVQPIALVHVNELDQERHHLNELLQPWING